MLEESNARGYTLSYSELENYTAAIGAPIFNHLGKWQQVLALQDLKQDIKKNAYLT